MGRAITAQILFTCPNKQNVNHFHNLRQTAVWFLGVFLKIYSGALHGKFMKMSRSVYVGAVPFAIGTNRLYSSH